MRRGSLDTTIALRLIQTTEGLARNSGTTVGLVRGHNHFDDGRLHKIITFEATIIERIYNMLKMLTFTANIV